jgi:hypothetical protein
MDCVMLNSPTFLAFQFIKLLVVNRPLFPLKTGLRFAVEVPTFLLLKVDIDCC